MRQDARLLPGGRAGWPLLFGANRRQALAQRLHEIDDLGWRLASAVTIAPALLRAIISRSASS